MRWCMHAAVANTPSTPRTGSQERKRRMLQKPARREEEESSGKIRWVGVWVTRALECLVLRVLKAHLRRN